MKIHHLNGGTLYPYMSHWVHGIGSISNRPPLVTHCLLVETEDGLLLVDTGYGTRDYNHPSLAVYLFNAVSHCKRDLKETAIHQIRGLGFKPEDVRHIAVTHMHLDHVGGLPDFPHAKVHIFGDEYRGITQPRNIEEKYVCRREHWAHGPDWVVHELEGEQWFGFDRTPPVDLGDTEFFFVPLPDHTRGHSAVVLRTPEGWLMHCGDAYVHYGEVNPDGPIYPPKYKLTIFFMGLMAKAFRVLGEHTPRLRQLLRDHGDEVQIFCTHDPHEFAHYRPDFEFASSRKLMNKPG